jgi:hypothetical protein
MLLAVLTNSYFLLDTAFPTSYKTLFVVQNL